jgi:hypothetical protein
MHYSWDYLFKKARSGKLKRKAEGKPDDGSDDASDAPDTETPNPADAPPDQAAG